MPFRWMDVLRPVVIAHRGAPALGPENTREGIAAAIAAGAQAIETDVRVTGDGVAVCVHDASLLRIAGVDALVAQTDLADLRRLHPKLLTLAETIAATEQAGLLLDIKSHELVMVEVLSGVLSSVADPARIMLGPRSTGLAAALRGALLTHPILAFSPSPDDAHVWRDAGADWFRLWESDFTEERLFAARAAGLRVAIMTGDWRPDTERVFPRKVGDIDPASLQGLLRHEPDGVLLDDPRLMTNPAPCHAAVVDER